MAVARYLVDKSAFGRLHLPEAREVLEPLIGRGFVAVCGTVALELLYSARSHEDHARLARNLDTVFEWLVRLASIARWVWQTWSSPRSPSGTG